MSPKVFAVVSLHRPIILSLTVSSSQISSPSLSAAFALLGFVHKNVRPETILAFRDNKSVFGPIFLAGFEKVRKADSRTWLSGDSAWERNLYRHPHRQGVNLGETYVMQHDIYSLSVCLLEIGMWESFVPYEKDATAPVPTTVLSITLGGAEFSRPVLMKNHLVALTKHVPPKAIAERYEEIVINCLTCMDQDNANFGDQSEFEDIDGVLVGLRCIEKILLKLGEILV